MTEPAWPFDRKKGKPKVEIIDDPRLLLKFMRRIMQKPYAACHYTYLERFLFYVDGIEDHGVPSSGPAGVLEIKGSPFEPHVLQGMKVLEARFLEEDLDNGYYPMYSGVVY